VLAGLFARGVVDVVTVIAEWFALWALREECDGDHDHWTG
jgi:hypothetical protein